MINKCKSLNATLQNVYLYVKHKMVIAVHTGSVCELRMTEMAQPIEMQSHQKMILNHSLNVC